MTATTSVFIKRLFVLKSEVVFVFHSTHKLSTTEDINEARILKTKVRARIGSVKVRGLCLTGSWPGCEEVCFLPPTVSHPPR